MTVVLAVIFDADSLPMLADLFCCSVSRTYHTRTMHAIHTHHACNHPLTEPLTGLEGMAFRDLLGYFPDGCLMGILHPSRYTHTHTHTPLGL